MSDDLARRVRGYYGRVAAYLDAELAARGDAPFWEALAAERAGGGVLELGAGTGRVTALLARHARRVVAVDLAPSMLERARRRLADQPRVVLLRADIRHLALDETFDLVVAADDPFCHLLAGRDRASALAAVARHLAPGGRFVLDALWLSPERARRAAGPLGARTSHRGVLNGQSLRVRERWRCGSSPARRRCRAAYAYYVDGRLARRAAFEARPWTRAEVDARFQAAGLEVEACWGGYDRAPWSAADSERLLVLGRRAGDQSSASPS